MAELPLAKDFPLASETAWQALVEEALKGAPFASLRSKTYDGIEVEPLYPRASDASLIPGRAAGALWTVMQRADIADAEAANKQILADLNNGATGLSLVFQGAIGDCGYALEATGAALSQALDGVDLDAGIAVELDLGRPSKHAAGLLATLVKARGLDPRTLKIRFGLNPLGAIATTGESPKPWPDVATNFANYVAEIASQGFTGPFAVADGRPVHAAGGSEAQELAFALACAVSYLRSLEARGTSLDDARNFIFFRLAVDQEQFLTTAKFRAIRKLWARIEEACALKQKPVFVSAETAWRMMTKRDPHGNIVRGTIAALAAAVGGADAITVLPYSAAIGLPDAHARRIARNTQTILIEESNLYRVADPAAGSGAIETLTDALCAKAWTLFQEIEREGDVAEALAKGSIQSAIATIRSEREKNIVKRKDTLIGTSDFPFLDEDKVSILGPLRPHVVEPPSGALPRIRLAEPFERLRDQGDAYLAKHGKRPKVFLATLGRAADFNARASFAKSFFEAGGIEAVVPDISQSGDLVKDFKASGATLVCLCSSDKVYAKEAEAAAAALSKAGTKHLYLAGKPGENKQALQAAGLSTFLHQGCDSLDILNDAYDRM
jgi:methylmalonyl-CoA mutase